MSAGDETIRLAIVGDAERNDDGAGTANEGERGSKPESRSIPTDAINALESKLESADGFSGLADWLREVEEIVTAIETNQVEDTRDEIREVIDTLLQINAEVQNLVHLKKLLS